MTRSRPAPIQNRRRGIRGRLVLTTALGGCLAAFGTGDAAAQVPVVAPAGNPGGSTLIGAPTGVLPGLPTNAIGVTQTGTIVDWQSFDIGTGQTVTISDARIGPAANGSAMTILNRVVPVAGPLGPTRIDGTLTGAGNIAVYIVNPVGIVFGAGSAVNVGGLIASTLDISDTDFGNGNYAFAAPGVPGAVTVAGTAGLTATGLPADQLGQVALIGARVASAGTLTATGDVALVAANDVTLTYDAANPLGFTVREGSPLGTSGMAVGGTVGGRSALFVVATRQAVTDAVLDMSAAVTATSALATDRGIVLIAGRNPGADARVAFTDVAGAPSPANDGVVSLALGSASLGSGLTAEGAGGAIRLASSGGIRANPIASLLAADQGITATALTGGIVLGDITGAAVTMAADAGDVALNTVAATGPLSLTATDGALGIGTATTTASAQLEASGLVTASSVQAGTGVSITGASTILGAITAGVDELSITTTDTAGTMTLTSGQAGTAATLTAANTMTLGTLAAGDLALDATGALAATTLTATGRLTAIGASLTIGSATATDGPVLLTSRAAGALTLGSGSTGGATRLTAGGALTVSGSYISAGSVTATAGTTGTIATLRSTGANLSIDTTGALVATTLGASAGLTTIGASLDIGTVNGGAVTLTSRGAGALTLGGGSATGTTTLTAGGALTVRGSYAGVGTVTATAGTTGTIAVLNSSGGSLNIDTAGALTATTLGAAAGLTAIGASLDIGTVNGGAVALTSRGAGALTLGGGSATGTTTLTAGGALTVRDSYTGVGTVTATAGTTGTIAVLNSGGGSLNIDTAGALTATTLGAAAGLTAIGASLDIGTVNGGAVTLTSRGAGALTLGGGTSTEPTTLTAGGALTVRGSYTGVGTVTATAGTTGTIGTLQSSGAAIDVATGEALTAARLAGGTTLTVTAAGFAIDSVTTGAGAAVLTAQTGDARLDTATRIGTDLSIVAATGEAAVTGAVTTDRDYSVSARTVFLGNGTAATQSAIRDVTITSTAGGIAGAALLTLRAARTDAGGRLVLDATGGNIGFAASSLLAGGTTRSADVGIGLRTAGQALRLGQVDARALLGVDAGLTTFGALATTGTIDLDGNMLLVRRFEAVTTGALLTRGIRVLGPGQGITLAATGPGSDVTVRGLLDAEGDIAIAAGNSIVFDTGGGVTSRMGNVTLVATNGTIGSPGTVFAAGRLDLTATALSIDTATAGTALALTATQGTLQLGNGTAGTTATLTKTGATGDLRVTGTLTAGGDVTIDSSTGAALGSIVSAAGTLSTRTTGATTATGLRTGNGDIALTAGTLAQVDTLDAGGAARLLAGDPALPDAAGAIRIGTATARTGALTLVAANRLGIAPAGIVIDTGTAGGAATLTSIGSGDIGARALTANGGAATVDAAGNARLGAVTATTGAVSIRAGAAATGAVRNLAATDGRLDAAFDGATLAAADDIDVVAGGIVQLGTLSGGAITAVAGGDAAVLGDVTARGRYAVTGEAVTLGLGGTSPTQAATDAIVVVSRTGPILGRSGLTLASDTDGDGGDLILRSAAGMDFAGTVLAAGGNARASAIRIGAGSGTAVRLGQIDARALVSYDPGLTDTTLRHDGAVTLGAVTVRDTLDVATSGGALAIDAGLSQTGDVLLGASGALTAATLTAARAIDATGLSVTIGQARAGTSASLTSSGGTLDVATVDAANGFVRLDAVGDLRLGLATATGAITANATGDITGRAVGPDFGLATLTSSGGNVAITTGETNTTSGIVRLAAVSGHTGVDVTGRLIAADSIVSNAGGVTITARRAAAGVPTVGIAIGTIDARDAVVLRSGGGVANPGGTGAITLDGAISRAAGITIANTDDGLAGNSGSRATLTAAEAIAVDVRGAAMLATADAGSDLTVLARSTDVLTASAGTGTLVLTARGGDLALGTGSAGTDVVIGATGAATIGALAAGRDAVLSVGRALGATTLTAGRDLTASAANATIGAASAAAGTLSLAATGGDLNLDTGSSGTDAALNATGSIGVTTLTAGRDATLSAGGAVTATALTAARALTVGAASAVIGSATARTDALAITTTLGDLTLGIGIAGTTARLDIAGLATIGTFRSGTTLAIDANRIDAAAITAGTDVTTRSDADSRFGTVVAGGDAALTAGTTLAIGSLDAGGDVMLAAGTGLTATTLTAARDLTLSAATLTIGSGTARSGALRLTATAGDLTLGTGVAGTIATLAATGSAAIGTLTSGSDTVVTAGGGLAATMLIAGQGLTAQAAAIAIGSATATNGALRLTALAGDLTLDRGRAGTAAVLSATNGGITAGRGDGLVAGADIAASARSIALTAVDAGTTLTATATTGPLSIAGGIANGAVTLMSGGAIAGTTLTSRTGPIAVDGAGAVTIGAAAAATSVALTGASIDAGRLLATNGPLVITARTGDLGLTNGTSGGGATLTAANGTATIGVLTAAGSSDVRAARVGATTIAAGTTLTVASDGDTLLGTGSSGGDATMDAGGAMTIGSLTAGGSTALIAGGVLDGTTLIAGRDLTARAAAMRVGTATARSGALDLTARSGDVTLATGSAGMAASLAADAGMLTIGRLGSGTTMVLRAAGIQATALAAGSTLASTSASDTRIDTAVSGGSASVTAGGLLTIGGATGSQVALSAGRMLTAGDLTATTGPLTVDAGGGATIGRAASAGATTVRAASLTLGDGSFGGTLTVTTAGDARIDRATAVGDALVTSGTTAIGALTATGSIRSNSGGAMIATALAAGQGIAATASNVAIGSAAARAGAVTLTATGGDLMLGAGSAARDVALLATGTARVDGNLGAGGAYGIDAAAVTLGTTAPARQSAGTGVTIVARNGAITGGDALLLTSGTSGIRVTASGDVALAAGSTLRTAGGDVTIAAGNTAALGAVTATGRTIALSAQDATLAGAITADAIRLTNIAATGVTRLGDAPGDNAAEFGQAGQRFDLTGTETGRLAADSVVIDSRAQGVRIGALTLETATGRTRFELRTTGRLDLLGRLTATGSAATRQIVLGGDGTVAADGSGGRASVIRVAATQGGGGRLLVGDATLDLRGERIGVGLDADFLTPIGFGAGGTPLSVDQVASRYVAQPTSTLYSPSSTGQPAYTAPVILSARSLIVRYSQYALFQNTGRAGETTGVSLGTTPAAPTPGALQLVANGGAVPNAFAIFGTVNGIGSTATSLLGADAITVDPAVSRTNSRANGCLIGSSGGGCLSTSLVQPSLNVFDSTRSEIFRTADDLSLPFDPLVGTNNEALFSDIGSYVPTPDTVCGMPGAAPCPPVGDVK